MSTNANEIPFTPQVGLFRKGPNTADRWWTPVVPLDFSLHSTYNIAFSSFALGMLMATGFSVSISSGWSSLGVLGLYTSFVSLYHICEYLSVAMYNPLRVSMESFMFQPDGEDYGYTVAMGISLIEYALTWWLFPGFKQPGLLTVIGLLIALIGQVMRTLAMVTAKTSFNHYIARRRETDHQLITHGIYKYERHPSYVGFFLWATGLQIMLKNTLSLVLFVAALGFFFCSRTVHEENMLISFFGEQYLLYKQSTPSLVPVKLWARLREKHILSSHTIPKEARTILEH
ncbi:farnesyl cysteine-carboxyl methyltransferase [Coemansia spiralis]|uniref:Protein-S-isoprenylcysteine O-methyltransferase n=2 Tax=Coemansia TaxID=4863 RepID=A0A9W8GBZ3_9FUNG|nr:farnesyl cysteine-carboxyl methyltransferase [Coemansia umbellata]KAJ2621979.1 farnesyl cysteine-carboxyl methyltransferase [Coemansia sp. RSA 1358]KAJ2680438.1 farnesyl cysteine-carboxyl methyltransferase [Coemansia spiralis]